MDEKVLLTARQLISKSLKDRREELGITQQQLAESSGMGIATIKRFESGRFWLNLKQYVILCHYLKCFPFIEEIESKKKFATMMRKRWERPKETN